MRLYENWREILRRSWCQKFLILAGVLSGVEIVLPLYADVIPRDVYAVLIFLAVAAAFVARLVAQKGI